MSFITAASNPARAAPRAHRRSRCQMPFDVAVADFPDEAIPRLPPDVPYTPWDLREHVRIASATSSTTSGTAPNSRRPGREGRVVGRGRTLQVGDLKFGQTAPAFVRDHPALASRPGADSRGPQGSPLSFWCSPATRRGRVSCGDERLEALRPDHCRCRPYPRFAGGARHRGGAEDLVTPNLFITHTTLH